MYTVKDVYNVIDSLAPFHTQYSWDNSGLQCGDMNGQVTSVTLALDVIEEILDQAVQNGSNLIVTHHPLIFTPLKKVTAPSLLYKAITKGVSIISAHTNLDLSECGVNYALANALGLKEKLPLEKAKELYFNKIIVFVPKSSYEKVYSAMAEAGAGSLGAYEKCAFASEGEGRFLPTDGANPTVGEVGIPEKVSEIKIEMIASQQNTNRVIKAMLQAHPYEVPAYDIFEDKAISDTWHLGVVGNLSKSMKPQELALFVKRSLNVGAVRLMDAGKDISKVAVCGGSGGSLIGEAGRLGAHALVTGDVKHDVMLAAKEQGLTLIDAGHFATENVVIPVLAGELEERLPQITINIAGANVDPVKYI